MNLDTLLSFFFEKASMRIKSRISKSGLTLSEIYPPDSKQISWITNNKRTKNNRFLICDAVIEGFNKDSDEKIGLLHKLKFTSKKELLWGSDKEIEEYLPELFELLWHEVAHEDSTYQIDKELFLCDYIPYAKYSTYWNLLYSPNNKYLSIAYGLYEDAITENIDSAREYALHFLYFKCRDVFAYIFSEFVNKVDSFHMINKVFETDFLDKSFIPMLRQYTPESTSLGIRVRDIIESDLSHSASMIFINEIDKREYYQKLVNASSRYVVELEEIQKSEYSF